MANILGFSGWFHDSSACLVMDGKVVAFAEEERFSRWKHSPEYPKLAIEYCLKQGGIGFDDLDTVVFTSSPSRLIRGSVEAVVRYFPKSLGLFKGSTTTIPVSQRYWNLLRIGSVIRKTHGVQSKFKLVTLDHYKTHLGAAFLASPFEEAAILNMDFATEGNTQTISHGKGNKIKLLASHGWPNAWGAVYLSFTKYLGFKLFDEYKVMGMAAYGKPQHVDFFDRELYTLDDTSGRFKLNMDYFDFQHTGLRKPWSQKLEEKLGPARDPKTPLTQREYDLAASLQAATERYGVRMARVAKKLTGSKNLCLAGGVVQNCLMNQKIMEAKIFDSVFAQPLCGDGGASMGAALYYHNTVKDNPRSYKLDHLYLGPQYSNDIEPALKKAGLKYHRTENGAPLIAQAIANGDIVGFFSGRMEAGPRALGGRSILADPRRPDMKDILNSRVKHREHFRPFAPSVLEEHVEEVFEPIPSCTSFEYMITTANVRKDMQAKLPAITHNDGTARLQAVNKKTNPYYWNVINEFRKLTGVPLVINTSFNDNEPIVCTPQNAIDCFMRTKIDVLALENYIVYRKDNSSLVAEA